MSNTPQPRTHPHDVGLPAPIVRKRHKYRTIAYWMLGMAALTAIPGWILYFRSFRPDSPLMVLLAWLLLLLSTITLVLGLWYLLLAQVRRVARIVEDDDTPADPAVLRCPNCGWPYDAPDRFCRHCGKPVGAAISARPHS